MGVACTNKEEGGGSIQRFMGCDEEMWGGQW